VSHIGVNLGFGNLHEKLTDEQMYAGELALAELAGRLGYAADRPLTSRAARVGASPTPMPRARTSPPTAGSAQRKPARSWSARSSTATSTRRHQAIAAAFRQAQTPPQ
jgi:hypothetical protein